VWADNGRHNITTEGGTGLRKSFLSPSISSPVQSAVKPVFRRRQPWEKRTSEGVAPAGQFPVYRFYQPDKFGDIWVFRLIGKSRVINKIDFVGAADRKLLSAFDIMPRQTAHNSVCKVSANSRPFESSSRPTPLIHRCAVRQRPDAVMFAVD